MEVCEILERVDHTLLKQDSKWADIKLLCGDAIEFKTASVCIPPSFVERAKEYVSDKNKICTVIGFPNGYSTTAVKCFEAAEAKSHGADEIDMVINVGMVKDGEYESVLEEIKLVREQIPDKVLKVIIETCLLTDEEKIRLCDIVTQSGADYIKTSTGFAGGGATREDVALLKRHVGSGIKIKASGGIRTLEDAEDFIKLGADRLGTSALVKIAKEMR